MPTAKAALAPALPLRHTQISGADTAAAFTHCPSHVTSQAGSSFEILEIAGRGGLALVYKSRRLSDGQVVALKMTHLHDLGAGSLLVREARILGRTKHPHIVAYIESGQTRANEPYLVMQYLPGITLQQWLQITQPTYKQAVNICRQVALAIRHAHQNGIVHRDIKPGNIMLDSQSEHAWILDFNISRGTRDPDVPLESGSVLYLAPEQLLGQKSLRTSDIYQLGLILFECLTGHLPFEPNMDASLLYRLNGKMNRKSARHFAALPQEYQQLINKCLSKNPRQRPCNMQAFIDALDKLPL
jgi:serine/threonine-protein kinase